MSEPSPTLQQLLNRAAAGDRDAQDQLVARCHSRVRRIVHRELEGRFRAKHRWILPLFSTGDVVQDVLTDVMRGLQDTAFPAEGAFVRYLATIVRNRLVSAVRFHEAGLRDVRRQVDVPEGAVDRPTPTAAPDLAASLAERAVVLREVLESFPQRQRTLLELRLVEGASFPDIAGELGFASAETVRQSFCRVEAKLVMRLRARGIQPNGATLT